MVESAYFVDTLKIVALYATIAVIAVLVLVGFIVFFRNKNDKEFFVKYLKVSIFVFLVYALLFGIILLVFDIVKHYDAAYLEDNYVSKDIIFFVLLPSAATLFLALVTAVIGFIKSKRESTLLKIVLRAASIVTILAIIASLVLIGLYYGNNISGDGYYTDESSKFNQVALYVSAILLVAFTVALAIIFDKEKIKFDAKVIARAGILIAFSFVLSYVSLFKLPQGGTVTLASSLPLMIFSYKYGLKRGLIVGFIFGVLQSLQDPFIIHPAQFLLDYPIAFAMLGTAGLFSKLKLPVQIKFTFGAIFAGTMRFLSHVLSGVFAFGAYAEEAGASNHLLYSLLYNSFVFVDIAIVVAVGVLLLFGKSFKQVAEIE